MENSLKSRKRQHNHARVSPAATLCQRRRVLREVLAVSSCQVWVITVALVVLVCFRRSTASPGSCFVSPCSSTNCVQSRLNSGRE